MLKEGPCAWLAGWFAGRRRLPATPGLLSSQVLRQPGPSQALMLLPLPALMCGCSLGEDNSDLSAPQEAEAQVRSLSPETCACGWVVRGTLGVGTGGLGKGARGGPGCTLDWPAVAGRSSSPPPLLYGWTFGTPGKRVQTCSSIQGVVWCASYIIHAVTACGRARGRWASCRRGQRLCGM